MKFFLILSLLFLSFITKGQDFHTIFEYTDSINKGITIKNSYPKGGERYIDIITGKTYPYVVFWTSITNETDSDLAVNIHFTNPSFFLPFSPDIPFKLFLPNEKMSIAREPLFDYGLDVKSFLDKNRSIPSQISTCIPPKESYRFYTLAISEKGVNGVIRAGYELASQNLIYQINSYKVNAGSIRAKD